MKRNTNCGAVNKADVGKEIIVNGWCIEDEIMEI